MRNRSSTVLLGMPAGHRTLCVVFPSRAAMLKRLSSSGIPTAHLAGFIHDLVEDLGSSTVPTLGIAMAILAADDQNKVTTDHAETLLRVLTPESAAIRTLEDLQFIRALGKEKG